MVVGGGVLALGRLILFAAVLLTACSRAETNLLDPTHIKVGVTDKNAVEALFGPPTQWSARQSEEVWTYVRGRDDTVSAKASRIPLVGYAFEPFVDASPGFVTIVFQNNIVSSCKIVMDSDGQKTTLTDCSAL
jgi:hypothetical protein